MAIMIIAYLERERSCARAYPFSDMRVSVAYMYTRAYTGCPTTICYYLLPSIDKSNIDFTLITVKEERIERINHVNN